MCAHRGAPLWTNELHEIGDRAPVARAVVAAALNVVGRDDEVRAIYEPLVPASRPGPHSRAAVSRSRAVPVLALVAQAMSNREVANALVRSERTVESHVRSILANAGLTTRTELVRWYLERPS